ncbi:MAG TPA: thiamine biosynthesis protein ThiS [Lachnospiraceae bacterium]|nr:thiamine biosynthesis protein ThiS [Lachnospiraceae bacterium]
MVTINGSKEEAAGMSVLSYLKSAGYDPLRVVVEKNLEIVPRDAMDQVLLEDGDSVEILRFVGGG